MNRGVIVVIVLGVMGFVFGAIEWQLKTVAKDTPTTISAADLASRRVGDIDNANIILTDYEFCGDYVVTTKSRRGGAARWQSILAPLVPAGQPCGGNIRIVVKDTSIDNEAEADAFLTGGSVRGIIINKISSVGSEDKRLLSQQYPGTDFSSVWIIENNRRTWPAMGVVGLMGVGGFAVLGGLAAIASGFRKR